MKVDEKANWNERSPQSLGFSQREGPRSRVSFMGQGAELQRPASISRLVDMRCRTVGFKVRQVKAYLRTQEPDDLQGVSKTDAAPAHYET